MKLPALFFASLLVFATMPTRAVPMPPPPEVPLERIVKNLEAQIAAEADNLPLRFQLARAHYLAYFYRRDTLPAEFAKRSGVTVPETIAKYRAEHPAAESIGGAAALDHAGKAAELFQQILEKDPQHALAHLGLASLLSQVSEDTKNKNRALPASLQERSPASICRHYQAAFEAAWPAEQKEKIQRPAGTDPFISYEAAQNYLKIVQQQTVPLDDAQKETVRKMEAALATLRTLPRPPVSPLIFSFRPAASITALLAPERAVHFDLRGYGAAERWPWLQAETAILVWDPTREGRITSSRQMFGTYSWQIFWHNGFEALAALDDNRDGWLRGPELAGLGVWRDRNQDAVSDPGEVQPLSTLDVVGLACTAPEAEGPHPLHRTGVEMKDGRKFPLWDWFPSPLQTESVARR